MARQADRCPVTLSYPAHSQLPWLRDAGASLCLIFLTPSEPSASPTEIPQVRLPAAIPTGILRTKRHTAVHLFRLFKGTEYARLPALMLAGWDNNQSHAIPLGTS